MRTEQQAAPAFLIGTVGAAARNLLLFPVRTTAQPPFDVVYLEPWAVRSAKPGDRVRLEYRGSATRMGWVVAEILVESDAK